MQQAGVVGVLHVLGIELPVARQDLAVGAEHFDALARWEHAVKPHRDLRTKEVFERWRRAREGTEDESGVAGNAQCPPLVVGELEIGRHAALAVDAALEGDRGQVAFQIVGPAVIDTTHPCAVARLLVADERAAMRAAVLESVDTAVRVACDDDGHVADEGRAPVARLGNLGFEAEIVPRRAHEEPGALLGIDVLTRVELIRNARHALVGPGEIKSVRHAGSLASGWCPRERHSPSRTPASRPASPAAIFLPSPSRQRLTSMKPPWA